MPSVLVPLAHGFEDLEAVTIVDLLRRAGIAVVTAGPEPGLVLGSRGTRIQPDATLDDALAQDYDLVAGHCRPLRTLGQNCHDRHGPRIQLPTHPARRSSS